MQFFTIDTLNTLLDGAILGHFWFAASYIGISMVLFAQRRYWSSTCTIDVPTDYELAEMAALDDEQHKIAAQAGISCLINNLGPELDGDAIVKRLAKIVPQDDNA